MKKLNHLLLASLVLTGITSFAGNLTIEGNLIVTNAINAKVLTVTNAAIEYLTVNGSVTGNGSGLTGISAAQVGSYTISEADQAIASAISGIPSSDFVLTNHIGDVVVEGTLAASAFAGDGFTITNLDLSAYVGTNLTWDSVSNKLNVSVDYSGTGGDHLDSADITNVILMTWQNLDIDASDDLTTAGATLTGDLNMSGTERVTNLAPAADDGDAISKSYLRSVLSAMPPQGGLSMGSFTNGRPETFVLEFN